MPKNHFESHLAQKWHVLFEEGNVEQHSKVIEKGKLNVKEKEIKAHETLSFSTE